MSAILLLLLLALAASTGGSAIDAQAATAPALPSPNVSSDTRPSFAEWLDGVRVEALARGIREDVVESALANIEEPMPVVIERDRAQSEQTLPLERYLDGHLAPKIVKAGRERYGPQKTLIDQVAADYGVPASIIVGVWGMESNFGRFTGVRPTIAALATLAWDPRRSAFFRSELFKALEILNDGDVELARMRGSWAGAMGQPQFLPSSYLEYAQDFDGDGRRDIWGTPADVFASIANYLVGHDWTTGQPWQREVRVPARAASRIAATVPRRNGTCVATRDMTAPLPAKEWEKLGVRRPGGGPLPASLPNASLVSGAKRHFLVFHNYDALLAYNCAHAYALSVALLGDRVAGRAPIPAEKHHRWPSGRSGHQSSTR